MADLLVKAFKAVVEAMRPLADPEIRSELLQSLGVPPSQSSTELLSSATVARLEQLALTPDEQLTAELAALASGAGDLLMLADNLRDGYETLSRSEQLDGFPLVAEVFFHLLPNFLLANYLRRRNPGAWVVMRLLGFIDDRAALPFGETFNGERWKALFKDEEDDWRILSRADETKRATANVSIGIAAIVLGKSGQGWVGKAPGMDSPRFAVPLQFRAYPGWDPSPVSSTPRADQQLFHFTTLDIVAAPQPKDVVAAAASTLEERVLRLTMAVPPKPIQPALLVRAEGAAEVSRRFGDVDVEFKGKGDTSTWELTLTASRDGRLRPLTVGSWLKLGDLNLSGWLSSERGAGARLEARGITLTLPGREHRDPVTNEALGDSTADATFDLDVQVDDRGNFSFGSAGVVVDVPVGRSVGPARIQHLRARLGPSKSSDGLELEAGVGLQFKLGPLTAVAEGVGIRLRADDAQPRNALLFHLEGGFKPPDGVGLALSAGAIKGSGYLGKDVSTGQYVGTFEVKLSERFQLAVTGLLATRLPDGSKAISLFLQGGLGINPGWPVGMGLSVTRVGVVLGYNRRFDLAAFRAGIKTGLLEALLAPPDPLANLAQTVSQLTTLFPPARGAHTIAVTARLSREDAVKIDLGLLYDTSAPSRIVAASRIEVNCKQAGKLKLAAVGALDLGKGELLLEAHLYDSKLAGVEIEGDAALLVRWGSPRTFVLAIGGFHKDYRGPERSLPVFSKLGRFTLKQPDSEVLKLSLEAYFALTPNTLQLGAQVDAFVGIERLVSLEGGFGFDALFEFDPFYFDAEIRGRVKMKVLGKTIAGARMEGRLRGPRPLRVSGKVTFEVLWWDVSYSFDRSFAGTAPPPPAPVDAVELVRAALQNPRAWEVGALPADGGSVRLVQRPSANRLLLHPLQSLKFVQDAVPLELPLDKVGGRPVTANGAVRLAGASFGGAAVETSQSIVKEQFSRGRFQTLSREQLFATPAFEELPAGAVIASDTAVVVGEGAAASTQEFVEIRLGSAASAPSPTLTATASALSIDLLMARSARVEAAGRRTGPERFLSRARVTP